VDSPLEGNGFEILVPRCLATANSVGAFISASGCSVSRRNSSIGLARPTTARVIPPRRLSIGPNPTEASKPLPIWRGTEISNPFSSSGESHESEHRGRSFEIATALLFACGALRSRKVTGITQFTAQQIGVPTPASGQLIVGQAIGLFLLLAPALRDDHRDRYRQPQLRRGGDPAVTGDQDALFVRQDRVGPPPF